MCKKNKKEISRIAYEKYQFDWLQTHGYSLDDIFKSINESMLENATVDTKTLDVKQFFEEKGFTGEVYTCYEEFLGAEYQDISYMFQLLTTEDFLEYLTEQKYTAYDAFAIEDHCMAEYFFTILEYGYTPGDSVTDNPEEICRFVQCDVEIEISDFSGDEKGDHDLINTALEESKQYITDVTEDQFRKHIKGLIEDGYKVVQNYHEAFEELGNYICFHK